MTYSLVPISSLPPVVSLGGTELIEVTQGGASKQATVSDIASYVGELSGLGTMAYQNANAVAITGGTISGSTTWTGTGIDEVYGGTGISSYTLGDILYSSASNTLAKLAGNTTSTKQFLSQTGTGSVSAAPVWSTISGSDITGAALTKTDDTNVTLTLGGSPTTALLNATSITVGWSGQLAATRGGTGQSTYAVGDILYASTTSSLSKLAGVATGNALISGGVNTAPSWGKIDLTAAVSGILPAANGGTANGFTAFSGPTTSTKTFTLPNASATILTDSTVVTVAQGGTGRATGTTAYSLIATGTTATGAQQTLANGATTEILVGGGASALPVWTTATGSGAPVRATSPSLVTPALGVATATSVNGLTITTSTGTLTIANSKVATVSNTLTFTGTDSSSVNFRGGGAVLYSPATQTYTSGSGTYNTPTGAAYLRVRMWGGGGGGAGSGTTPGAATAGGNTTFGAATASGGAIGTSVFGGAGGSASGGTINITGNGGYCAPSANAGTSLYPGGNGGAGPLAGGGVGQYGGGSAAGTNSGAGGGGAGSNVATPGSGGGGAGGYVEWIITSPSATYSYAVGAGGTGGTAGTSGFAGGNGGAGFIIIEAY